MLDVWSLVRNERLTILHRESPVSFHWTAPMEEEKSYYQHKGDKTKSGDDLDSEVLPLVGQSSVDVSKQRQSSQGAN